MSVFTTTRFGLTQWTAGTDPFRRSQAQDSFAFLEAKGLGYEAGTSLPTADSSYLGFLFLDTDDNQIYYCDGTQWWQIVGGEGGFDAPVSLSPGNNTNTGSATTAARGDHVHAMAGFATTTDIGTSLGDGSATTLSRANHVHKLGTASVTTTSLADGVVDLAALASSAVANSDLAPGAVTTTKIGTSQVTNGKLNDGAVTEGKIANGAVTGDKFGSFDASKVTTGVFNSARIPNLDASKVTSGVFPNSSFPISTYIPTGAIVPYSPASGSIDTSSWLLCDGQSITSSSHPALHSLLAAAGYPYGGSGSNANVPDLRQRFPLGKADSGTGSTLGSTGGTIDHFHTGSVSHSHTGDPPNTASTSDGSHTHTNPNTNSGGSHSHTVSSTGGGLNGPQLSSSGLGLTSKTNVDHNHTWSDTSSSGSSHNHSGFVGSDGSHTHFFTGTSSTLGSPRAHEHTHAQYNTGSESSHTHTIGTSGSGGSHSHDVDIANTATNSVSTNNTGASNPPYIALNFVIKI